MAMSPLSCAIENPFELNDSSAEAFAFGGELSGRGGLLRQPQERTKATWSVRRKAFHIIAGTPRFHEQPDWQAVHLKGKRCGGRGYAEAGVLRSKVQILSDQHPGGGTA